MPSSFSASIIIPVEKNKMGANSFDNYRPISLVTMVSKVFEYCLANRLNLNKNCDPMQFGFTNDRGCQKALLTVDCVVNYFNCRGSSVYMASLDASKAFDRVNHYNLFIALMNNNVPLPFVKVIIFWHFNLRGMVRWCGHFSDMFCIKSGIRQGGINSPLFFNIFINELIVKLRNSGHGCYIADMFCGCIFFADDILLLSASLCRLQLMLNICVEFAVQNDVKFNHLKSHLFQCGMSDDLCLLLPKLSIGVHELEWVKELKYLGVVFVAGKKLSVNIDLNCRKFLSTSYAILQKCKYLSEEVLCKLILTNCLPIRCYMALTLFL